MLGLMDVHPIKNGMKIGIGPYPYLAISCHILPYLAISCPRSYLKPQDSVAAASSDERDDQLVDPDRADPATFGAECADQLVEEAEATQLCHVRFEELPVTTITTWLGNT